MFMDGCMISECSSCMSGYEGQCILWMGCGRDDGQALLVRSACLEKGTVSDKFIFFNDGHLKGTPPEYANWSENVETCKYFHFQASYGGSVEASHGGSVEVLQLSNIDFQQTKKLL